ncbi:MAG: peptide deformylase [Candidatus Solibacter usitatus]|nr:peptide deformylase [Candidatus Solibacter usitatus]
MAARRILQLGDPVLRMVSLPVGDPASAAAILGDLEETLAEFRRAHGFGRGISAIQIGEPYRIIYLKVDGTRFELINPEFTWRSEERFELWDDCFSFPDLMVRLSRHRAVRVRHQDLGGGWHELEAHDALSELVQHEMDHLDGILAVDHATGRDTLSTREEYLRRLAAGRV